MPIKNLLKKIKNDSEGESDNSDYINLSSLTEAEREIITNTIALRTKNVKEIIDLYQSYKFKIDGNFKLMYLKDKPKIVLDNLYAI